MIIVLGIAGSGKSTLSRLLADNNRLTWVSMGAILRREIQYTHMDDMQNGNMIDDQITIPLIDKELSAIGDDPEVILDGFPRTLNQASWLLKVSKGRFNIRALIHLHTSEDIAKGRLLGRGRQDDTMDAIAERFEEYEHTIKPIINSFADSNIPVVRVNAEESPTITQQRVIAGLNAAGVKL